MNRRNFNRDNSIPAFMVPNSDKNGGTFWKGYIDLGGGKALRLVMFEQKNPELKSEFVVKCFKKSYNKSRANRQSW